MAKYFLAIPLLGGLFAAPALAQSTAVIDAPPSNVRNAPNGAILCTLSSRVSITVYQKEGQWYYTDACGGGYIHQSQIRLQGGVAMGNRARVTGIRQGQLALRSSPNGRAIAGLNNGNVVQILEQKGNWAYVQVVQGPNRRVTGLKGWVNSYFLALF